MLCVRHSGGRGHVSGAPAPGAGARRAWFVLPADPSLKLRVSAGGKLHV